MKVYGLAYPRWNEAQNTCPHYIWWYLFRVQRKVCESVLVGTAFYCERNGLRATAWQRIMNSHQSHETAWSNWTWRTDVQCYYRYRVNAAGVTEHENSQGDPQQTPAWSNTSATYPQSNYQASGYYAYSQNQNQNLNTYVSSSQRYQYGSGLIISRPPQTVTSYDSRGSEYSPPDTHYQISSTLTTTQETYAATVAASEAYNRSWNQYGITQQQSPSPYGQAAYQNSAGQTQQYVSTTAQTQYQNQGQQQQQYGGGNSMPPPSSQSNTLLAPIIPRLDPSTSYSWLVHYLC